jgi:lysozyme
VIFGVDISDYQPGFDLHRAAAEGFEFAFLKATEGSGWKAKTFPGNLHNGQAAGLVCAAYHYVHALDTPGQVDNIRAAVPTSCPLILDIEAGSGGLDVVWDLHGRLLGEGYSLGVMYLPQWYASQIGASDLRGLPPLWSSRYPNDRAGYASAVWDRNSAWLSAFWGGYGGLPTEIIQFTDQGVVAGHNGIDCSAYRGTKEQLAALLGGGSGAAGGIESMALDTQWTDSYGNVQTVQSFMADIQRKINDVWYPAVAPGSVPSRIPGDTNTTNVYDMVKDSTAWTHQLLGLVIAMSASQGDNAAAVAEALKPALTAVIGPIIADAVKAALGADNQAQADAIVNQIANRLATTGAKNG